ncbi:MAG TPA: HAMP domain-containing sensor histidine kinase [Bacillota bacterium]|nr:HAMP domain-containing sensor histidine kinase [Bacillota bacterium]
MKLRTKIQLFSSVFILVLMLLINTSIYYFFYHLTAESELDDLSAQTDEVIKAITQNPDIEKKKLLSAFLPNNGMIQVISKNDKPILILEKPIDHGDFSALFQNNESQSIKTNNLGNKVAVISKPIVWEDGELVTIQVSKQLLTLQETMTTLFYVLALASLVMLIPAIIGGRILGKVLLQPIQALIQTMKRNTEHEKWKKLPIHGRSRDELFEMKKTFNDMIDHLESNFHKQEIFVSDASHELKTPISIIKSYAQLLDRRDDAPPELLHESIEAIESEADRMQLLVEQMLLLANNKGKTQKEKINIVALFEDAVHTFQGANDRNIISELKTDMESVTVYGNANQLQQIIYILIDNALKYSNETVKASLEMSGNHVLIRVIDHGPGISKEEQEHIFERFYRVDKARSRETGGTGLGLSIAKTIAVEHNGDLLVDSQVNLGTIFTLQLPTLETES